MEFYEKDMYKPLETFLNGKGYEVFGEVKSIDIIGRKKDNILIVEMKKNLNMKVLTQAYNRRRYTSNVYIAVLKPKKKTEQAKRAQLILSRLGVGLLYVNALESITQVQEKLKPRLNDDIDFDEKDYNKLIKELEGRSGSYNRGGIVKEKIITAYREQAIFIGCCLIKFGKLSSKQLKSLGTTERCYEIMYQNHYKWFEKVGRGVFDITDKGKKDIEEYTRVVKFYREKLNKQDLPQ